MKFTKGAVYELIIAISLLTVSVSMLGVWFGLSVAQVIRSMGVEALILFGVFLALYTHWE